MINDIKRDAETRMQKCIESFKYELTKLRTGRAHPSLLEHVKVSYYGTDTPLAQVASITIENSRMLIVTPWEKNLVSEIDKAIRNSDLGLNPATAGSVIRVPLPPLNEERRKELVKVVRDEAEKARVSIRNIRRDANAAAKDLLKEKMISEDEERNAETNIQKLTDKTIQEVEKVATTKETELMAV